MRIFSILEERRRKDRLQEYDSLRDELQSLYEADDLMIERNEAKAEEERGADRWLSWMATVVNLLLLGANLTASILSGSLAIISTFIDSAMDLTSNIIIFLCLMLIKKTNQFHYPRGRERLELVGVLICSILMGVANIVVIFQSVLAIVGDNMDAKLDFFSGGLMLGGAGLKIVLAIICYRRSTPASKVLAMDMRNDAVTCLTAFFAALIAHRWWKYADPIGAILVCSVIAFNWFSHAIENIPQLVGVRGEAHLLSRIIRVSIKHDHRIKKIDHAMVYQTGSTATVEIHVVLDENMPLRETHDICHSLEKKLSKLSGVERAYVHCDYECDGDHFVEGLFHFAEYSNHNHREYSKSSRLRGNELQSNRLSLLFLPREPPNDHSKLAVHSTNRRSPTSVGTSIYWRDLDYVDRRDWVPRDLENVARRIIVCLTWLRPWTPRSRSMG